MEPKDPVRAAEEILSESRQLLAAETIKAHAEMALLATVTRRPMVQAGLMHKASAQGIEYMSGLMLAVGLTARNWGRILADNPGLEFTKYINPEAEAFCDLPGDGFAHYLVREILLIEDTPAADKLRQEMREFLHREGVLAWGQVMVHVLALYGDLIDAVLDIRNGDYVPEEEGDDR